MAWAKIQSKIGAATSATFDSTTTSGSLIIVAVLGAGVTPPVPTNVTDTRGNTYTQDITAIGVGNAIRTTLYSCVNSGAQASNAVTANYGTPPANNQIFIAEFTGNAASSPYDQGSIVFTSPGSASANANVSNSVTPTQAGELIVGWIINTVGTAWTAISQGTSPNAFTIIEDNAGEDAGWEYFPQTTAASIQATWTCTNTNGYVASITTYKALITAKPWYAYAQQ